MMTSRLSRAPWRRSIARSPVANASPGFSTICAPYRRDSRGYGPAVAGVTGMRTKKPRQHDGRRLIRTPDPTAFGFALAARMQPQLDSGESELYRRGLGVWQADQILEPL